MTVPSAAEEIKKNIYLDTLLINEWLQKVLKFFLFLYKDMYCEYSLEPSNGGSFNKYPQHTFSRRSKKNIYLNTPMI